MNTNNNYSDHNYTDDVNSNINPNNINQGVNQDLNPDINPNVNPNVNVNPNDFVTLDLKPIFEAQHQASIMNNILVNNLNALTENIQILSGHHVAKFNSMDNTIKSLEFENQNLRDKCKSSEREASNLKRRLDRMCCSEPEEEVQRPKKRYRIVRYRKIQESLPDEELNAIFQNIKSIDDIINLENIEFKAIRHNRKLQKLRHIIEPLKMLQALVGLDSVKNEIFKHILFYVQDNHNKEEMLHTIITGPPGVGKTELGRIIGHIYLRLGLLENDVFKQVRRSDLIAGYLGQTALKTQEVIDSCLGGVLFIDEAYSLGNSEQRDSFSKECIDTINQNLTENKSNLMCIIAGYPDELDNCFFKYNPGLKRRFTFKYSINKYDPEELAQIMMLKLSKDEWELTEQSQKFLPEFLKKHKDQFEFFGGDIEKFIFYCKLENSKNTFNSNERTKNLSKKDLTNAIEEMKKTRKQKEKPPLLNMYI